MTTTSFAIVVVSLSFLDSTRSLAVHSQLRTLRPHSLGCLRVARVERVSLLADEPPPPEVIEAEDKATPNRKYRLATAAGAVGISSVAGGLAVASLAGQEIGQDVLLFGSPFLTLGASTIIGGTGAWAWNEEQKTKRQNIARIWEEVQLRRRGGGGAPGSGANRSQRRAKKVPVAGGAMPGAGGFGQAPSAPTLAPKSPPSPPPTEPEQPGGGLFAGVQSFFDEANAMGKAQAVNLNAQLEDAGVLKPLAQQDTPPSGAVNAADATEVPTAAASPPTPSAADDAVSRRAKSGSKKKKKKKARK